MMNRYSPYLIAASVLLSAGCGKNTGSPDGPVIVQSDGGTADMSGPTGNFVRLHYAIAGGDVKPWGIYFYGAGSTSPPFSSPQKFDKSDDFGGYTDIKITATSDTADAWLGLIPVLCNQGNCKKDVETQVRFVDLQKNQATPTIAECWIIRGQAVQLTKPVMGPPQSKIFRPMEFIDLGNGSVRLMFRVPPGSTGTVAYGTAMDQLTEQVSWVAADDINKNGLIVKGLTPGTPIFYKISSDLKAGDKDYKDESAILSLTPIAFSTIADTADWATWGSKSLMYELMVRTFADGGGTKMVTDGSKESGIDPATKDGIGDLVGLRNSLPYLKDLGVDAIWMTPVFKAKSYHGYDTTDFYDIDPAVGTMKDFQDLTAAVHLLNIRIVLDLVENHVADVNPWFIQGLNKNDPMYKKYHEWFVWTDDYENMYTDKHPFDDNSVIWACRNYQCYHQIFGSSIPELNFRNPEVRAEMKKISKFWLDRGADGFRLDASKHIDQFDDNNGIMIDRHGTHVWWKEFNYYVKKQVVRDGALGGVILAGENRWDDPAVYKLMLPYAGDMDSQFDFPFRSYLSNFLTGKGGNDVDFVKYMGQLQQDAALLQNGGNPNHYFERFLSNHDLDRPASQFGTVMPLDALLKQAGTIVLTVPGMPVIYYGEEFGKKGQRDTFQKSDTYTHDEFIREPMSWFKNLIFTGDMMKSYDIDFAKTDANPDNMALMLGAGMAHSPNPDYPFIKFMADGDPASLGAQKSDMNSLYGYYKKLIAIRKGNSVLTDLDTKMVTVNNAADVYEFSVAKGAQKLSVVLSRMNKAQTVTRPAMQTDLISGTSNTLFTLPPYGALILQ